MCLTVFIFMTQKQYAVAILLAILRRWESIHDGRSGYGNINRLDFDNHLYSRTRWGWEFPGAVGESMFFPYLQGNAAFDLPEGRTLSEYYPGAHFCCNTIAPRPIDGIVEKTPRIDVVTLESPIHIKSTDCLRGYRKGMEHPGMFLRPDPQDPYTDFFVYVHIDPTGLHGHLYSSHGVDLQKPEFLAYAQRWKADKPKSFVPLSALTPWTFSTERNMQTIDLLLEHLHRRLKAHILKGHFDSQLLTGIDRMLSLKFDGEPMKNCCERTFNALQGPSPPGKGIGLQFMKHQVAQRKVKL